MTLRCFVVLLVLVCSVARPGVAATISLGVSANAANSPGDFDQIVFDGQFFSDVAFEYGVHAHQAYNVSNLSSDVQTTAVASALAANGMLAVGVYSESSGEISIGAGGPVLAHTMSGTAGAGATVSDSLTVVNGDGTGNLLANFLITGHGSASTSSSNDSRLVAVTDVNALAISQLHLTISDDGTAEFPSMWQVAIPYSMDLASLLLHVSTLSVTQFGCGTVIDDVGATCAASTIGAFGNTFLLTHIQVYDNAGQLIPDAYVVGDSGLRYNNTAAPEVPEPASIALMLTGFGWLASAKVAHRRRRVAPRLHR
jgi:hypothetical protein